MKNLINDYWGYHSLKNLWCLLLLSILLIECKPRIDARIVPLFATRTFSVPALEEVEIRLREEFSRFGIRLITSDSVNYEVILRDIDLYDTENLTQLGKTLKAGWVMKSSVSRFPKEGELKYTYVITTVIIDVSSGIEMPAIKLEAESYDKFRKKSLKELVQHLIRQVQTSRPNVTFGKKP